MKDIVSLIINAVVTSFIVYGFITVGSKLSTFAIIINIIAIIAVSCSTYANIKNLTKKPNIVPKKAKHK